MYNSNKIVTNRKKVQKQAIAGHIGSGNFFQLEGPGGQE